MLGITLTKGTIPAVRQICVSLRESIGSGALPAGAKLPSTRRLAEQLGVARNTAIDAYEQLIAEGYLESRVGSGTYVAEGVIGSNGAAAAVRPVPKASPRSEEPRVDFTGGSPDLSQFPRQIWGKHLKQAVETIPSASFGYGDIFGDIELRTTLADYLFRAKGIRADPAQIAVVSGSSEGFLLIAKTLADRFRSIYIEDPTVEFGRDIFASCGYRLKPVDVDEHGIRADDWERLEDGHLMLLTPSHQFPSGSILSIQRRRKLIALANRSGAYLIEDDYDSEFRFRGAPVPPMHALAPDRVVYVGTFSKTLTPGLRIGFAVIPWPLIDAFARMKDTLNLRCPNVEQRALALMIRSGDFERHVYRMLKIYRQKRAALVDALREQFGGDAKIYGDEAGMHLLARFDIEGDVDWHRAASYGLRVQTVDDYRLRRRTGRENAGRHELVFGYGHLSVADIREGVSRLREFLAGFR